jgi:membrane protein DedA with SNARE-associated domain
MELVAFLVETRCVGMPDLNQLIADWGYLGIVLVVVLGNVGLPVPEETVLALAGYLVTRKV